MADSSQHGGDGDGLAPGGLKRKAGDAELYVKLGDPTKSREGATRVVSPVLCHPSPVVPSANPVSSF